MSKTSRFVVCGLFFFVGCASSSPDNYVEASSRIACKKMKKCDDAEWTAAGFDNVSDCVDQSLDAPVSSEGDTTVRDAFVSECTNFDSSNARKCLAGMRKVKRKCDDNAMSLQQEVACSLVCGNLMVSELFSNPNDLELALTVMAEAEDE